MTRSVCTASLLPACLLLSACSSPREDAAKSADAWKGHAADTVRVMESRSVVRIEWDAAVERMMRDNPEVRAARAAVVSADSQIERVWLDMLPMTTMTYAVRRSIAGNDPGGQLSVWSFINIGGVIGTRMRYYSAVLSKVRAEYAYQATVRERTVALWQVFREWKRLDERRAWMRVVRAKNLLSSGMGGNAALSEYLSEYSVLQSERGLRSSLSGILGDHRSDFTPVAAGLPSVDYLSSPLVLSDVNRVGLLASRINGVELEGARLRMLGASLAFWPDVSIGVSGPAIYSSGPGGTGWFNSRDVAANAAVTWRPDTQLSALYSLNETKRQVGLFRQRIEIGEQERIRRLEDAMVLMKSLRLRNADVDRRIATLLAQPAVASPAQYAAWASDFRSLIEQRASLGAERDALDAVFWFADESRWPSVDPWERVEADAEAAKALAETLSK